MQVPAGSHEGQQLLGSMHRALSSSSLASAVGMQRASSSAGLGKADSADASLEALLAELSSASATAAAALAPFTSPSTAQQAAESDLYASAPNDQAAAQLPFASSSLQPPFASASLQPSFAPSSQQVVHSSSSQQPSVTLGVPPCPMSPADLTVDNVSQLLISHQSILDPAAGEASSASSSPQPAAVQSPSSQSPGSSSPLETSHPGSQFVDKLQSEFKQYMAAFDDDLSFIQEVQTHRTLAAGMNPNVELQTLHKRFNNWKFDFKVSVTCTEFVFAMHDAVALLCCAVLCCAVLCCAVLCCAVLCCAVLCCAVLCCAAPCREVEVSTSVFVGTVRAVLPLMLRIDRPVSCEDPQQVIAAKALLICTTASF